MKTGPLRWLAAMLMLGAATMPPESTSMQQPRPRSHASKASSARRGRPRKFSRPSRVVNLTLPDDVIAQLKGLDQDLSRAIVRAAETLASASPIQRAELTAYGNRALIVVPGRIELLEALGAELVPLADGRALISFDNEQGVPQFELKLMDALADPALDEDDRSTLATLAEILRSARQTHGPELRQRRIIVLQWNDRDAVTA
jgi:hypothetical protein